jgi:hypothetical protein
LDSLATMGPKTTLLVATLEELAGLLRARGETHWAAWLESDLQRLRASDFDGITHLLFAFGGMGSFNDLMLDARLSDLRSRAWSLANDISREAVRRA